MRGRKPERKSKSFRKEIKRSICSASFALIMWQSLINRKKISMPGFWFSQSMIFAGIWRNQPFWSSIMLRHIARSCFSSSLKSGKKKAYISSSYQNIHRILNIAEIYWRKAKYEWLRPSDYISFAKYKRKIKEIFNKIGIDYKIIFKELNV